MSKIRFVGLDVHAETIAVAVAEPDGEVRSLGAIPNKLESVRKMIGKLGTAGKLKCCYEAGPTGYVLYWQLTQLGVACQVIAPSLIPTKAGDRVKTDRRDADGERRRPFGRQAPPRCHYDDHGLRSRLRTQRHRNPGKSGRGNSTVLQIVAPSCLREN